MKVQDCYLNTQEAEVIGERLRGQPEYIVGRKKKKRTERGLNGEGRKDKRRVEEKEKKKKYFKSEKRGLEKMTQEARRWWSTPLILASGDKRQPL